VYTQAELTRPTTTTTWQSGKEGLGTYLYLKQMMNIDPNNLNFDYLDANDMSIVSDADKCIQMKSEALKASASLLAALFIAPRPADRCMLTAEGF
jgi:hypothetical protein